MKKTPLKEHRQPRDNDRGDWCMQCSHHAFGSFGHVCVGGGQSTDSVTCFMLFLSCSRGRRAHGCCWSRRRDRLGLPVFAGERLCWLFQSRMPTLRLWACLPLAEQSSHALANGCIKPTWAQMAVVLTCLATIEWHVAAL